MPTVATDVPRLATNEKPARVRWFFCRSRTATVHATAAPRGARVILPAFRHRVQTFTLVGFPSISTRATWRFGFHDRRTFVFECDRLFP
jgi:hypothetical protein